MMRLAWKLTRALRRVLAGPTAIATAGSTPFQRMAATQAAYLVQAYYLFSISVTFMLAWECYGLYASGPPPTRLWPLFWQPWLPNRIFIVLLLVGVLLSAGACVLFVGRRLPRLLFALSLLFAVALQNSYGSTNHSLHIWLWLAWVFLWAPSLRREDTQAGSRRWRHSLLTVFFAAQLLVATFYTLSGFWKAWYGFFPGPGGISSFAPEALQYLVANRWLTKGFDTLLRHLFIDQIWISWPGHLLVIYVELFTVVVVFRPSLHRIWGSLLASFHVMVWMLMGIGFPYQPTTLALLFVLSPFAPLRTTWASQWRAMPVVGDLIGLLRKRRSP